MPIRPAPPTPRRERWRRDALIILLLASILRIVPVALHGFAQDRVRTVDSPAYLALAGALREHGRFALDGHPETFRTPGYPVVLAGLEGLPGPPEPWLIGLQILLDLGVVAAALVLGRRWWSDRAGLAAGLLVAVDPVHLVGTHLVMADVAAAAAVAAAFVLADRGRPRAAVGAGILLSAATALRPVTLLLALPLAYLICRRGTSRRALALALAAAAAFPAAWTVRNGVHTGIWSVSTAFDLNLGLVVAPKVVARAESIPLPEARRRLSERGVVIDPSRDPGANRRIVAAVLLAHPLTALHELAVSSAEMLLAGERRHVLQLLALNDSGMSIGEAARGGSLRAAGGGRPIGQLVLVSLQLLFNAGVLVLAFFGARDGLRHGRRVEVLVALGSLVVVLGPSLVVASARMRVPISLFLALLAGIGLTKPSHPQSQADGSSPTWIHPGWRSSKAR